MLKHPQSRPIGPVKIIEHDEERVDVGGVDEKARHALEEAVAFLFAAGEICRRKLGNPLTYLGDQNRDVGRLVVNDVVVTTGNGCIRRSIQAQAH